MNISDELAFNLKSNNMRGYHWNTSNCERKKRAKVQIQTSPEHGPNGKRNRKRKKGNEDCYLVVIGSESEQKTTNTKNFRQRLLSLQIREHACWHHRNAGQGESKAKQSKAKQSKAKHHLSDNNICYRMHSSICSLSLI